MHMIADRAELDPVIDAIYETSLIPGGWPALLERLARLFHAGFADVFARTHDRSQFHGLAYGLDRADYDDVFLGHWFKRNVWGLRRPVEVAGEIMQTREMLPTDELMRSDIYNDYLADRGLHEGLRLAIWSGDGWIQDISLLRPFSIGPYERTEIAMAQILLPHLQRAAAVARRLGETDAALQSGMLAFDSIDKPVFLLDGAGRVMHHNQSADALLVRGDCLFLHERTLSSGSPGTSLQMAEAFAYAGGPINGRPSNSQQSNSHPSTGRQSRSVALPRQSRQGYPALPSLVMTVVPLGVRTDWAMLRPPAAMAFVNEAPPAAALSAERLVAQFQLTAAEAELALDLVAGSGLADIAGRRGRSINTIRTQLRHVMGKTHVHRQTDLVRLLMNLQAA